MARVCMRHRVWWAHKHARRGKHQVLSDALGLDHRDGPEGDGEELTIAERLPARDGFDPARVVQGRERLAQITAGLTALTTGYRSALVSEGRATAKRRYHARQRLQVVIDRGGAQAVGRTDGRRYSDAQIERALALVAQGHSLADAGAAVGAAHTTVLRWLRKAA
jgi:hypothetical protein